MTDIELEKRMQEIERTIAALPVITHKGELFSRLIEFGCDPDEVRMFHHLAFRRGHEKVGFSKGVINQCNIVITVLIECGVNHDRAMWWGFFGVAHEASIKTIYKAVTDGVDIKLVHRAILKGVDFLTAIELSRHDVDTELSSSLLD